MISVISVLQSAYGEEWPYNCKYDGRQHVGNLDLFAPHKVKTHAENQHGTCQGQIRHGGICDQRLNETRQESEKALEDTYRNC